MDKQTSDYKLLGFVLASEYRSKILRTLGLQMATPKQLSQITGLGIGHVSNVIRSLVDKKLIECINFEAKKGRIYRLTADGCRIFKMLSSFHLE